MTEEIKKDETQDDDFFKDLTGISDEDKEVIRKLKDDPIGMANLLMTKRASNKQAKDERLAREKLQAEKDDAEKAKLAEKGEFEKLSEKLKMESASKAEKFKSRMILKELQVEAINLKIRNKDDVKLASMDGLDFNDESLEVTGAKEAIEKLKEERPYLFHDGEEGEEDENGKQKAHEQQKGSVKTNLKKFDVANTNTRERFALGFKKN